MRLVNRTGFHITEVLDRAIAAYPTDGLTVELKYCRAGSRSYCSGTYYRRANGFADGKLIRVRINPHNVYPVDVHLKTSDYEVRTSSRGERLVHQRLERVSMNCAEDLILAVFLHEFSHYLDHIEGRNGRFKQTKADKFALAALKRLGIWS